MMTLDLAIHHALATADRLEQSCDCANHPCGAEHRQLAAWLIELKQRRERETTKDSLRSDLRSTDQKPLAV